DHDGARFDGAGREFLADAPAGGEEGDLHVFEAVMSEFFDLVRFAGELNGFSGAARTGEQLEVLDREFPLGKDGEKFLTHSAGGADDGNIHGHGSAPLVARAPRPVIFVSIMKPQMNTDKHG